MSYAITRIKKYKGGGDVSAVEGHINRDKVCHSNKDIDWSLTHQNYSLIGERDFSDLEKATTWRDVKFSKSTLDSLADKSFNEHASDNIRDYHTAKAKKRNGSGKTLDKVITIRKDAVKVVTAICTSDYEFFENKSDDEEREFFQDCLQWYIDTFGKHNIFSAVVHKDERGREDKKVVPHLHITFTPITDYGELSANHFFYNKKQMQRLQDSYYEAVGEKWKLERGERADFVMDETGRLINRNPKSAKKHTTNQQWKNNTRKQELDAEIAALETKKAELEKEVGEHETKKADNEKEVGEHNANIAKLGATKSKLKKEVEELDNKRGELNVKILKYSDEHTGLQAQQDELNRKIKEFEDDENLLNKRQKHYQDDMKKLKAREKAATEKENNIDAIIDEKVDERVTVFIARCEVEGKKYLADIARKEQQIMKTASEKEEEWGNFFENTNPFDDDYGR